MKITSRGEYGLRCMIDIAFHSGNGPVSIAELSRRQKFPRPYVAKILSQLKGADLIYSIRGAKGGYELARPPRDITLRDIFAALEGDIADSLASRYPDPLNGSMRLGDWGLRPVWLRLARRTNEILEEANLQLIVEKENQTRRALGLPVRSGTGTNSTG